MCAVAREGQGLMGTAQWPGEPGTSVEGQQPGSPAGQGTAHSQWGSVGAYEVGP